MLKRAVFAALLFVSCLTPALAQLTGGVQQYGAITAGDCTKWYGVGIVQDSGGTCGGSGTITANTTATSGFSAGNPLYSDGSKVQAGTTSGTGTVFALTAGPTFTGTATFANTIATVTSQSGTTYTFASTDCGTFVLFTSGSAITATIPNTLVAGCAILVYQSGAGKVSVNGSAVTPATLHSAHSYTGTSAQYAVIGIDIVTNAGGTSAVAALTGDGS